MLKIALVLGVSVTVWQGFLGEQFREFRIVQDTELSEPPTRVWIQEHKDLYNPDGDPVWVEPEQYDKEVVDKLLRELVREIRLVDKVCK